MGQSAYFLKNTYAPVMNAEICGRGKIASWVRGPAFSTWVLDLGWITFTSGAQSPHLFNKEVYSKAKIYFHHQKFYDSVYLKINSFNEIPF